jgi:hypothetical protein
MGCRCNPLNPDSGLCAAPGIKQKAKSDPIIPTCVGCERVRWQQKKIKIKIKKESLAFFFN